jgi:pyruvate dehydrogenase E1 component beta subunit
MREIKFVQAIIEALEEEMTRDETVFIIGLNVQADPILTPVRLVEKFGTKRLREVPIAEPGILGCGVGAALAGYRPIVHSRFVDFFMPAADELFHKAAKWRYIHGGKVTIPVTFLAGIGGYLGGGGPEHSQCLEGYIMHTPGLKLAIPTTPYDLKGLLKTAIRDNNPTVVLYHRILVGAGTSGLVPEEEYTIPFGQADIKREGKDVTVVATGLMVFMTLQVADQLQEKGLDVEVLDPRTLEPLDIETILSSVKKTHRLVIVDEDTLRCSVGAEIGMQFMEKGFDYLDAPIKRVGAANSPIPGGFMECYALPQPQDIADAITEVLGIKESFQVKPLELLKPGRHMGERLGYGKKEN